MRDSHQDDREPEAGTAAIDAAPVPLNEQVFRILRAHIVDDVFEPGLVLRESSIVEAFGVGRVPAAMALRKLEREGLIRKRRGHGFVVVRKGTKARPQEIGLDEAGLVVPESLGKGAAIRTWRDTIYPEVEKTVASLLVFGRFQINQSALAEHYGVSRTIAHEILTSLENMGFVQLASNARWYAGPLTFEGVKESYELRWLLEPVALRQAASRLADAEIARKRERVEVIIKNGRPSPEQLNKIEADLHNDLVLRCANQQMRRVLIHCQLPIITTFGTVSREPHGSNGGSGVPEALVEHWQVLDLLLKRRVDAAAEALHDHVRHAFELCSPHFKTLPPLPMDRVPPYMTVVHHR